MEGEVNSMSILSIIGIIIGVIVLILLLSAVVIQFDLASYTATGAETLTPTGASNGSALVVYNPGLSGAAKKAAASIAEELKGKGYNVTLAGVRSSEALNTADYDVIIAGGPVYFGKVASSIDNYLKTLKVPDNVKIAAFGQTGTDKITQEDVDGLQNQFSSIQSGNVITKTIRNSAENVAQDTQDLVSNLTS